MSLPMCFNNVNTRVSTVVPSTSVFQQCHHHVSTHQYCHHPCLNSSAINQECVINHVFQQCHHPCLNSSAINQECKRSVITRVFQQCHHPCLNSVITRVPTVVPSTMRVFQHCQHCVSSPGNDSRIVSKQCLHPYLID